MPEISLREWKLVGLFSLIIITITFLPNLVGIFSAPGNSLFWGLQTVNPRDTPIYYSWIEQAKDSHLLFKNLYTSEIEPRFIFDPFWLGVGLFAKIFSLSGFAAYQLTRIFLIPVFLAIAYIFISYFFPDPKKRLLCFVFLIFASGISGWVWPLVELGFLKIWPPPIDLWSIESSTFYTLYHSPHFIASLLLTVLIFFLILKSFEKQKYLYSLSAGFSALFLFFFHPYHVPTVFVIPGLYIVVQSIKNLTIRWNLLKHYFVLVAISSPAILYHLWTLNTFWTRQQFALQNNLPTPPFYNFLLAYGFIFIFAIFGILTLLRKKSKTSTEIFLLVWFFAQLSLPFMPFLNFQRKLIEGLHFAMVLLAIEGIYCLKNFLDQRKTLSWLKNPLLLVPLFSLTLCFSAYYVVVRDINLYLNPKSFVFLKKENLAAMVWLKNNTPEESIIFSSYDNGNIVPAFARRTVYLGSTGNTAAAGDKTMQVELFFQRYSELARAAFLKKNDIDYLFYGQEEKGLGDFKPEEASYLEKVYQNSEVTIYKVKKP